MARPNYKQIEHLLKALAPFKHGHSMHAVSTVEAYEVYSYRTLIARYEYATGDCWINPERYSVTTSKQQNLLRRAWAQKPVLAGLVPDFP